MKKETLIELLLLKIPTFKPHYLEHIEDNQEILPHVLFGDFTRFTIEAYKRRKSDVTLKLLYEQCIDFVKEMLNSEDEEVVEIAKASFLENLDTSKKLTSEILSEFINTI